MGYERGIGSPDVGTSVTKAPTADQVITANHKLILEQVGDTGQIVLNGADSGILTDGYICIHGGTIPVDFMIGPEGTYMLGISSDVGSAPIVVLKQTGLGPFLRLYNPIETKVCDWNQDGRLQLWGGLGSAPNLTPILSGLVDSHTGIDFNTVGRVDVMTGGSITHQFTATAFFVRAGDVLINTNAGALYFGAANDVDLRRNFAGVLQTTQSLMVGSSSNGFSGLYVKTSNVGDVGFIVNGKSGQTADLTQTQANGTVLTKTNAAGVMFPVQKATASAPTYVEGGLYYDTTLHKLRVGGASGWETVTSA